MMTPERLTWIDRECDLAFLLLYEAERVRGSAWATQCIRMARHLEAVVRRMLDEECVVANEGPTSNA